MVQLYIVKQLLSICLYLIARESASVVVGTPGFRSPESITGIGHGMKTDIWFVCCGMEIYMRNFNFTLLNY